MASTSTRGPLLRREVGELRRRESRRVFDAVVYVGALDGTRDSFVVRASSIPVLDPALRIEIVSSLVEDQTHPAPLVGGTGTGVRRGATAPVEAWLTRAGPPEPYDSDLAWLAAATTAFGAHGLTLGAFHAVTRYGWLNVRTGETRTWQRLRL